MSGPVPALAEKAQPRTGALPVPKTPQKLRPAPAAEQLKDSLGNQASIAMVSQGTKRQAKVDAPTRSGAVQVSAFLDLSQGPVGFAIHRWDFVPAEGVSLSRAEREVLDAVMRQALFEAQGRQRHKFVGTLEAKHLQLDLSINVQDMVEGVPRNLLVSRVAYLITAKIDATRGIEQDLQLKKRLQFRHAENKEVSTDEQLRRETAAMHDEIADVRREMREGMEAQGKLQTMLAQFAAFLRISPPPDVSHWRAPEDYLKLAEKSLANSSPRDAEMFMESARGSLHDQQAWWDRYKRDSDFGDEVVGPVIWQFLQLASLGVVEKDLFDRAERESKIDHGQGEWLMEVRFWILFACEHLLDRIVNFITVGAWHGWKDGVVDRIEANPNDPLNEVMLYAGEDAVMGVINTVAPVQEAITIWHGIKKLTTGEDTFDKRTGKVLTPDLWAGIGAFSNAFLKMVLLGRAAKKLRSQSKAKQALKEKARDEAAAKERAALERAGTGGDPQSQVKPGVVDLPSIESPHLNVLLRGVSIAQFEALLAELERSTEAGREVARKVRSGEIDITLDVEGIGKDAQGRAIPNQVHIKWGASLLETASTVIHEVTHALDPLLKDGPREQVEASARLSEFEYRSKRDLAPKDATERAYRKAIDDARAEGKDLDAAAEMARKSMLDAMQRDPKRYGLEPQKGAKQLEPAKSPTTEPKPAEGSPAKGGKKKSTKHAVLTDTMRELKPNERALPKPLLEQLKKVKVMPDYLYRQLLAGGEKLVKLFLDSNEKKRNFIKAYLRLRDYGEMAQEKDANKGYQRRDLEEDAPNRRPSFKDLNRDPTASDTIDALERGQGTYERGESARIGMFEEVSELLEKVPELNKQGYHTVLLKTQFDALPWLKKIFFGNEKPDMVAVGDKKILVGDATTSLQNEIPAKYGPGTEPHFEKTIRQAREIYDAIKLNPEFSGYVVYAVDYLRSSWAQMTPKLIGEVP